MVPFALNMFVMASISRWNPPGPVRLEASTSPFEVKSEYQSARADDMDVCETVTFSVPTRVVIPSLEKLVYFTAILLIMLFLPVILTFAVPDALPCSVYEPGDTAYRLGLGSFGL